MNILRLSLIAVLWIGLAGCEKKTHNQESLNKSEEFFKDIEAPAANNMEAAAPAGQTTAKTAAVSSAMDTQAAPEKPTNEDIQRALTSANLYHGKIDGVIGPRTKQAIEEFQSTHNLKVDGKVGPKTWTELKQYYQSSSAETTAPSTGTAGD